MRGALMRAAVVAIVLTTAARAAATQTGGGAEDPDLRQTAAEAYIYAYPLVLMDVTRQVMTARAPVNRLSHRRVFPDHHFTGVVSPNADTLYSIAWLDLGEQPLVLSVPAMAQRYYVMQMLDAWTNVFAAPGTRTTGNQAGHFAIVGPHWRGELPPGLQVLRSPTDLAWLLGRIQTNGKSDFPAVNALQDRFTLVTLSTWLQKPAQPSDVARLAHVDVRTAPVDQVAAMDVQTFFARFADLLAANPPAPADAPIVERMQRMGLVAGKPFLLDRPDASSTRSIEAGVTNARATILARAHDVDPGLSVNGWTIRRDLGEYGTQYEQRALVAWAGLGANLPEDAVYPSARVDVEGRPLDGAHDYVLHFAAGSLPPANAFWSLTMYNDDQFFVDNPVARYALGDRDALQFNPDGSLDLYLRHDPPGAAREANWLPAPDGPFNVMLRIYWPKPAALDGSWLPPAIQRTR